MPESARKRREAPAGGGSGRPGACSGPRALRGWGHEPHGHHRHPAPRRTARLRAGRIGLSRPADRHHAGARAGHRRHLRPGAPQARPGGGRPGRRGADGRLGGRTVRGRGPARSGGGRHPEPHPCAADAPRPGRGTAGRGGQAAGAQRCRGPRAGGEGRVPGAAAGAVPEPPLGQRLPHPALAAGRGRAGRGVPLRVAVRALAAPAQGRLARVGRPGGGGRGCSTTWAATSSTRR